MFCNYQATINIRRRTQRFGKWKIYSRQSTIYVEPAEEKCDIAGAYAACKQVFGIIAITRALPCEKSKEAIFDTAKTYLCLLYTSVPLSGLAEGCLFLCCEEIRLICRTYR